MTIDPSRRENLLKAKLRGLVRSRWASALTTARDGGLPGGAALLAGDTAWALGEDEPGRSLGPALAWARKNGASQLHLLVAADAGTLARRAGRFSMPTTVWQIVGTELAEVDPEPLPPEPPLAEGADAFRGLLERAGTDPVVEHGILRGEILGLEVARIVDDEHGVHLEVGVGKHDREAHKEARGTSQGLDALFEVVRTVAEYRRPGKEGHEAFHLAPERWLRTVVMHKPELVDAEPGSLEPVSSPVFRSDLRRPAPAPLRGTTTAGRPLLVVCSVGLDLDVMSGTADAYEADGREPELVLCIPASDAYPAIRDLAALHVPPARVVTVPSDWRSL
ncbi:MAG TPA: hypothetical protein VM345_00665 [Acidimicrobiales bacterium]|jgi:hypothetical protein|nr:hypothetical protein [Acidimicrobiales bacterium]